MLGSGNGESMMYKMDKSASETHDEIQARQAFDRRQPNFVNSFCSHCGFPLEPGARFCPNCGSPINGSQSKSNNNVSKKQRWKPLKWVLLTIAAVGVVVAVILSLNLFKANPETLISCRYVDEEDDYREHLNYDKKTKTLIVSSNYGDLRGVALTEFLVETDYKEDYEKGNIPLIGLMKENTYGMNVDWFPYFSQCSPILDKKVKKIMIGDVEITFNIKNHKLQQLKITWEDGAANYANYNYDGDGRLISIYDDTNTIQFYASYDINGRIIESTNINDTKLIYSYDINGRPESAALYRNGIYAGTLQAFYEKGWLYSVLLRDEEGETVVENRYYYDEKGIWYVSSPDDATWNYDMYMNFGKWN